MSRIRAISIRSSATGVHSRVARPAPARRAGLSLPTFAWMPGQSVRVRVGSSHLGFRRAGSAHRSHWRSGVEPGRFSVSLGRRARFRGKSHSGSLNHKSKLIRKRSAVAASIQHSRCSVFRTERKKGSSICPMRSTLTLPSHRRNTDTEYFP